MEDVKTQTETGGREVVTRDTPGTGVGTYTDEDGVGRVGSSGMGLTTVLSEVLG